MNEEIFESIFVDIKFQDKVITCRNIYRSPCNNGNAQKMFLADLDDILRKINKRENFLLGDFNYSVLNSDEPNVTKFIDDTSSVAESELRESKVFKGNQSRKKDFARVGSRSQS